MFEKIFYGTGFGERMNAARAAYLLLMWLVIPTWLMLQFMNTLVGLAFTGSFSALSDNLGTEISYRNPSVSWTGDIGLENLRVRAQPGSAAEAAGLSLDVRKLVVDMPNWGVMQQFVTAGDEDDEDKAMAGILRVFNRMDHVGVRFEGFQFDSTKRLPGMLGNIGFATGAPFEAEGCVGDNMWLASEMPKLGIDSKGVDLQLTLANVPESREVQVTGSVVSPQSSRTEFAQHYKAANLAEFMEAPAGSRIAIYERVAIEDEGFIAARDKYCAKRDGIDRGTFRDRHLAAMHRLLEAKGMRATPAVEAVYLQYLEKGKLVLEAKPNGNIRREDYHHYSLADQMGMFRGTVAAQGRPIPLSFEAVPARPFPEAFKGSTWDLIAAENVGSRPDEGGMMVAATAAEAPVAAKPAPAAIQAAPTSVAAAPAAPAPVAAAPVAAAPAPRANPLAAPMSAPVPGSRRTTADGRPLASSLPPSGNTRRQIQDLRFEELPQHVGDFIEITTEYGMRREGHVDSVRGTTLRLRVSAGHGHAIVNVERSHIRAIRFLR